MATTTRTILSQGIQVRAMYADDRQDTQEFYETIPAWLANMRGILEHPDFQHMDYVIDTMHVQITPWMRE